MVIIVIIVIVIVGYCCYTCFDYSYIFRFEVTCRVQFLLLGEARAGFEGLLFGVWVFGCSDLGFSVREFGMMFQSRTSGFNVGFWALESQAWGSKQAWQVPEFGAVGFRSLNRTLWNCSVCGEGLKQAFEVPVSGSLASGFRAGCSPGFKAGIYIISHKGKRNFSG